MGELTRTLERPGAVIRFRDSGGSGRPVVFLRGAGMDHTSFAAQAAAARDAGYRAVLVDQRAHGLSPLAQGARFTAADALDDLVALIDDLELRSEEHTSELQSRENLVCRLLLEKKKKKEE